MAKKRLTFRGVSQKPFSDSCVFYQQRVSNKLKQNSSEHILMSSSEFPKNLNKIPANTF
jgi:hypothetical protein